MTTCSCDTFPGPVGIGGAPDPTVLLTVAGVPLFNAGLHLVGSATNGVGLALENTEAGGRKYDLFASGSANNSGAGAFAIYDETGNAYRLTITPAGNVGIGTTAPHENLTVAGVLGYDLGLKLTGSTSNGVGLALENAETGGHKYALFAAGSLNTAGAGAFAIYDETANGNRLTIAPSGNVGIGTISPQQPLDVAGTVRMTGILLGGDQLMSGALKDSTGTRTNVDAGGCYYAD